jgi:hypothetical protein
MSARATKPRLKTSRGVERALRLRIWKSFEGHFDAWEIGADGLPSEPRCALYHGASGEHLSDAGRVLAYGAEQNCQEIFHLHLLRYHRRQRNLAGGFGTDPDAHTVRERHALTLLRFFVLPGYRTRH